MRVAVYDEDGHHNMEFGFTFDLKNTNSKALWYVVEFAVNTVIAEDKRLEAEKKKK